VTLHSFRRTRLDPLPRRLSAKQVQAWFGHHSPAFTLATYVHLVSDDLPERTSSTP
jgi:integrase